MHAWYALKAAGKGLALVEARSEQHARAFGADLGATPGELQVERLPPNAKRPLVRRFKGCPHCRFLRESGFDIELEAEKARAGR